MASTSQPPRAPGAARPPYLSGLLDLLLVLVVALFISLKLKEYYNINLVLLGVALVFALRNVFLDAPWSRAGRLNLLDVAVAAVALHEVGGYFVSAYRANSFYSVAEALALFLFYWLVRLNLEREYQQTALYLFLSLWGVLLSAAACYYYYHLSARLRALGFEDITDFRNHIYFLNPVGLSVGEWCTVLFLLLPFPLALLVKFRRVRYARWLLTLAATAILGAMALTFIRGVYIGAAAFVVVGNALCWLYGLFPARRLAALNLAALVLLSLALSPVRRPVLTTLSLFGTTSQVRSFEGRKTIWKDSLAMVEDHPWFGVGSNNFPMRYAAYRAQSDDAVFAVRPFNYVLHILIEKGVVGLLVYGFFFFSLFLTSHRKLTRLRGDVYRQSVVVLFVTAVVSAVVRDMSESSILINHGVGALLWFMFALLARSPGEVNP
jgi:putative inorganic carbon (HCO3(-)) transporter